MAIENIAFIGGGNMATSLIGGLISDGYDPERLWVSEPDGVKLAGLAQRFRIRPASDTLDAVGRASVVVLAVKPQVLEQVARQISATVQGKRPLVVSIAAGVREADLGRWLGAGVALVRSMPNTPAMIQTGATVLHANAHVTDAQRDLAESILRAVGLTLWVEDESQLDAVTALSGSGPAYVFLVMEAMEEAATELGLPAETARLLTLQTTLGAARMAIESSDPPQALRARVTSPGGTTERALEALEQGGLRELFRNALVAARDRSRELSEMLGRG